MPGLHLCNCIFHLGQVCFLLYFTLCRFFCEVTEGDRKFLAYPFEDFFSISVLAATQNPGLCYTFGDNSNLDMERGKLQRAIKTRRHIRVHYIVASVLSQSPMLGLSLCILSHIKRTVGLLRYSPYTKIAKSNQVETISYPFLISGTFLKG